MTFVHAVAAHSSVASQLAEHLHPEHGAGLLSVSAPSHCCLLLAHIYYIIGRYATAKHCGRGGAHGHRSAGLRW
jgi:hypothetical protein